MNFQRYATVAVLLALGVAASIILISVAVLNTPGHVTEQEATLLSTVLGAAVGAIATYLGAHGGRENDPPEPPPPDDGA